MQYTYTYIDRQIDSDRGNIYSFKFVWLNRTEISCPPILFLISLSLRMRCLTLQWNEFRKEPFLSIVLSAQTEAFFRERNKGMVNIPSKGLNDSYEGLKRIKDRISRLIVTVRSNHTHTHTHTHTDPYIYIYIYIYCFIIIWKSDLTDKMKRSFFQAAVVSILQYGCTTWTLTKWLEKKLDGNYTRMLQAILNKSWRQYPTRHQLYDHLPPITKTIQVRRTRHAGHCWRSRDELISDVPLWTPHMAGQKDDQHEHAFSSYVRIRDVDLKTCQRR